LEKINSIFKCQTGRRVKKAVRDVFAVHQRHVFDAFRFFGKHSKQCLFIPVFECGIVLDLVKFYMRTQPVVIAIRIGIVIKKSVHRIVSQSLNIAFYPVRYKPVFETSGGDVIVVCFPGGV